jgi:hypothetical protein
MENVLVGTPPKNRAIPERTQESTRFDRTLSGKYDIRGYQYPTEEPEKYGGNYVIFYINVNEDSRMLENNQSGTEPSLTADVDTSNRVRSELAGKNYDQATVGAAQAFIGAGGGAVVGQFVGVQSGAGGVAGGVLGASSAIAISANTRGSTFSRPQKRLRAAISLYVPNLLSVRYGTGWSDEETFGLQALIEGGTEIGRAISESAGSAISGKFAEAGERALRALGNVSSIVAAAALNNAPNASALSALSGLAPNPKKEQIFRGVDFRSFTFDYEFAPRDKAEALNVLNIVNAFKYHMHPEYKDAKNFLFLYPSEFDIVYYHYGEENKHLHRHTSCVLTEMNVNYTPYGQFNVFAEGIPTHIRMSLTFRELAILTKNLVAEGY